MIRHLSIACALYVSALPLWAKQIAVPAEKRALEIALSEAVQGDVLILASGLHDGPVLIDRPLTLSGEEGATIDAHGTGSVITVDAKDVTIEGLTLTGSGLSHETIDAGVKLTKNASNTQVINNKILENLVGVDIHGAHDALVEGNYIEGLQLERMNDRGNGVYVWNAPGSVVNNNEIRYGRDGIFSNTSKDNVYSNNLMRDLRFAIHYMYTNDSLIKENISVGNHLGYALMYSDRIVARDNVSVNDRDHGLMLNYTNQSDIFGNYVSGGTEKCTFIYNSHRNLLAENVFEQCEIGVHFTAGSERNTITGNSFIGNRTQVKYVGAKDVEWSFEGRGNYWSDHPAFDLNGDGLADSIYRPNDLMDQILWSQPSARLLMGTPAVQLVRWSQEQFPAARSGGVVDSHPIMQGKQIQLSADVQALKQNKPIWTKGGSKDEHLGSF